MLDSHDPLVRHVTVAVPPKSHVALQDCPISLPAQFAGQEPLTREAVGTAEQLVGGSAHQNNTKSEAPQQSNDRQAPSTSTSWDTARACRLVAQIVVNRLVVTSKACLVLFSITHKRLFDGLYVCCTFPMVSIITLPADCTPHPVNPKP